MDVAGTLEYLSELLSSSKKGKKKKQMSTVSIKIRMDCEGCARKVKQALSGVKGPKSEDVDLKQRKATVTGFVDAKKVLKAAQSTGKKCELWPYVPYNLIAHPYVAGVYDKKAPPNLVRATDEPGVATQDWATDEPGVATLDPIEEKYTLLFNDENPNACNIM